ncbi:hypothetical protein MHK_009102, partial [Candidatus Magnetomorum sp. HK-1]
SESVLVLGQLLYMYDRGRNFLQSCRINIKIPKNSIMNSLGERNLGGRVNAKFCHSRKM